MRQPLAILAAVLAAACGAARLPVQTEPAADAPSCRAAVAVDDRPAPPLVWSTPDENRARLDAWCAAVGPAVIAATPAAAAAPVAAESVAFVTWNTHVGGGDVESFVRSLQRGDLTEGEPIEHLVLLLQEVFRGGAHVPARIADSDAAAGRIAAVPPAGDRSDIASVAERLGLALAYVPSMRNGRPLDGGPAEDRGNAILSSLPLSEVAAIELPFDRQRRVAVAATISGVDLDGTSWRLRVASSHLNATASMARLWLFASGVRAAQARRLAAALGATEPTILGSDLNTWADGPREPAVRELRRVFDDTTLSATESTFRFGLRLDYLFFRLPSGWSAHSARVPDRFGSDHHPLLGRVRID